MTTNNTTRTTYGDLRNGDRVWIEGYVFTVANVRTVSAWRPDYGGIEMHGPGRPVVRFEGRAEASADIAGTGYDGGTYGGIPERPCTIVARA